MWNNRRNLMAVEESLAGGSMVLVLEKDGEERDFTGVKAMAVLERLKEKGALFCVDLEQALVELDCRQHGDGGGAS